MKSNEERITNVYFHETFPFYRPQVSQVLKQLATVPHDTNLSSGPKRKEFLRQNTQLGTRQVLSMSDYARGGGLVNTNYRPTSLGHKVLGSDPLLKTKNSQWLIHYHLSAPHGPGHLYWHELVRRYFRVGTEFGTAELTSELAAIMRNIKDRDIAASTIDGSKSAFINTYWNPDALINLGILESPEKNRYLVLEPDPPSIWVFGIALVDYWQAHYGNRQTINLDDLYIDGGLGDLFLIGGGRVNSYLRRLQEEGYVELYRVAPPYQLVLLQRDPQPLLEKLYAFDESD